MINEEDQSVREISSESQESSTRNNENNEIIESTSHLYQHLKSYSPVILFVPFYLN